MEGFDADAHRSRHACSLHVVEADARYPEDNWLQRRADRSARGFGR